ncbi:autotransporter assembly complex protein TamA [Gilliamella sp. B3172]|uniref:autotransporter assembly complex protein TamA n=1 Tax=Gilliamella sp. B3172 TaxID=2818006 RepID=UPI003451206D
MPVSRLSGSLCLLLAITTASSYADMKLSIKGLSGELEDNVDARISLITPDKIDNTPNFKRYFESETKKALRALGYYSPTFRYDNQDPKVLVVHVSPGEPVKIEKLNVNITGEGQNDADFQALLSQDLPKIGDTLNHGVYESFKKSLQSISLKKGYFDADMTKHQLAVADMYHQAFWNIDFNTGQRYKFGKVNFHDAKIRKDYLDNIVPFKEGEAYTAEQLSLLNRRLASTNWFNSVVVSPDFPHLTADKALPIDVVTTPRKKNSMDLGLGFSTDNGVHGKIGWNKPWINSRGQSFQSNLSLSSPEQLITMSYKIPLKKSPLEQYYTIQGGYKKIDNNDTYSRSYTFGALRNWDNFKGWQTALGFNLLRDDFTQGDSSFRTFLYYPSLSISRIRTDGNLLAMWGDSQRYSIELASESLGSDINLVRFQAQQTWIRSLKQSHRFIARGNFGIIQASNFDRVPPSFRFFAGGDRSIRGYSYQSISPEDKKGKLKGASKLITGSAEYQYNFTGAWWGAMFIDTGEAIDKVDKAKFYTGTGVGVRWASPVGPIKVDLATPLNRKDTGSIHLYIGLGSEL